MSSFRRYNIVDGPLDTPCWEFTGFCVKQGYGVLSRRGKRVFAHRVSYEEEVGEIPDGNVIRHRCDNPPCINPDHLICGTQAQNNRDRALRGRGGEVKISGPNNRLSKLSEDDVICIRRRLLVAGHGDKKRIREDFGISRSQLYAIQTGQSWRHHARV